MRHGYAWVAWVVVAACGGQRTSPQVVVAAPSEDARASGTSTGGKADAGGVVAEKPVEVITGKAHADGNHYGLDVKAPGTVSVGGKGELEVVLVAKDGYHINAEFPYKLKTAADPSGIVAFDKAELARGEGSYTKTEARFHAAFAGARAGAAKIGGTLALSVCTSKECVTDRIVLEVPVTIR
jgi:hypothetical protein